MNSSPSSRQNLLWKKKDLAFFLLLPVLLSSVFRFRGSFRGSEALLAELVDANFLAGRCVFSFSDEESTTLRFLFVFERVGISSLESRTLHFASDVTDSVSLASTLDASCANVFSEEELTALE